jgi:hypothetical protein
MNLAVRSNVRIYAARGEGGMNCGRSLELMSKGKILADPIITHHFRLDQIHDAFRTYTERIGNALKVVIHHVTTSRALPRYLFPNGAVLPYHRCDRVVPGSDSVGPALESRRSIVSRRRYVEICRRTSHEDIQRRRLRADRPVRAGLGVSRAAPSGPRLGPGDRRAYLLFIWLLAGLYLPEILHMGLAHRALEFKGWFIKSTTLACNALAIYVEPRSWVNRHRHHHAFSDRDGDPNKLGVDGFWKTLYLCLFPYRCQFDMARDPIFESWPMRLVASPPSRSPRSSRASRSSGRWCSTGPTRWRCGAAYGSSDCGPTWCRTTGHTTAGSAPAAITTTTTP